MDHRPQVAARRRAEMEARLLSAALLLLSQKPFSEISVNDLIHQVGVSRGTFYKYFDSLGQVFTTLFVKLEAEITPLADALIARIPSAAKRVATGTRLILHVGSGLPVIGKLMLQSGWPMRSSAGAFLGNLDRDIRLAITQGSFDDMPMSVATNLIIGPMLGGLQTLLAAGSSPGYAEDLTQRILLSLGMSQGAALEAVAFPLPDMQLRPDGLMGEILSLREAAR
jgi:AcrR family transcriptional regulator